MSRPIDAIIFDLDGTLIDTMGGFADLAGELIAREFGLSFEESRSSYLETSGIPFHQQLEVLFPGRPENAGVAASFETRKVAIFLRESVSDGTIETLYWLKDRGYHTAISSSNGERLVRDLVQRERIPVDVSLGYAQGFSKGAHHFGYVREFLGLRPGAMLFVGDSLRDARIAMDNGVPFLGKVGTFRRRDFARLDQTPPVPTIDEIPGIIPYLEKRCRS